MKTDAQMVNEYIAKNGSVQDTVEVKGSLKVMESLEFGYVLLESGDVLSSKGEYIAKEDYAKLISNRNSNKLDWCDVEESEVSDLLDRGTWKAKLTEEKDQVTGCMKMSLVFIDEEGTPFILMFNEMFGGSATWRLAETSIRHIAYSVGRDRPDLEEGLTQHIEEMFGTTDQVGTIFSPEEGLEYTTKKFVKDHTLYSLVFKNGVVSNLKVTADISHTAQAQPNTSEIKDSVANRLANGGFDLL